MKAFVCLLAAGTVAAACSDAYALDSVSYGEEVLGPQKRSAGLVSLDDSLFGEQINPFTGGLSFVQTDISLPGNNALPVALTRKLALDGDRSPASSTDDTLWSGRLFGEWDLDIPHLSGTYTASKGWIVDTATPKARCSSPAALDKFRPPYEVVSEIFFESFEIWSGISLVTGSGEQPVGYRAQGTPVSTIPGTRPLTTASHWQFTCMPNLANDPSGGEGFVGHAPDGTKYFFNWMTSIPARSLNKRLRKTYLNSPPSWVSAELERRVFRLYPTRVEDRFGNSVTYNWTGNKLNSIVSSDGRQISLTYNAAGRISGASTAGVTFNAAGGIISSTPGRIATSYTYSDSNQYLSSVTRPDGFWSMTTASARGIARYASGLPHDNPMECQLMRALSAQQGTIELVHPSGAKAVYNMAFRRLFRSNLRDYGVSCARATYRGEDPNLRDFRLDISNNPTRNDVLSVFGKTFTGPSLSTRAWHYDLQDVYTPDPVGGFPMGGTRTATVTSPDGSLAVSTFGTDVTSNESMLLWSEVRQNGLTLQRTEHQYVTAADMGAMPFVNRYALPIPYEWQSTASDFNRPLKQTKVRTGSAAGGAWTNRRVEAFDVFARPISVYRWSELVTPGLVSYSRTDSTAYHDDFARWIVGQVKTLTVANSSLPFGGVYPVAQETVYDPATALPMAKYVHGQLKQSLTYHLTPNTPQTGAIASVADARNAAQFDTRILLGDWMRGIPKTITYPATPDQPGGTTQAAAVSVEGWIESVTDENTFTTGYTHQRYGVIRKIIHPTGDTIAWNDSEQVLDRVDLPPYGLIGSHWRMASSTGAGRRIVWFDGQLRPIVEETWDDGSPGSTRSLVVKRYDAAGNLAFQGYPVRTLANWNDAALTGTRTFHDALGRVTRVDQDSEHGVLSTHTAYLDGLRTQVTNPRNFVTTTSHVAWDEPAYDMPSIILHPEHAKTEILRNAFGQVTTITRSSTNTSLSVSRTYEYDAYGQVCKSVEPETFATLMRYNAAGMLVWSAGGQTNASGCGTLSHPERKADRTYDARGRLKTLRFSDTRGDQDWVYTPDGLPQSVITVNVPGAVHPINQYIYNKRRMLTSETQHLPAWYSYSTAYTYDPNGNLSRLHYPSSDYVDFAPNALGQATRARNATNHDYAAGVTYHPNGAIAGFTYGNGIVHAMTQNARQLPHLVTDGAVLKDDYGYDANGNVMHKWDTATGGTRGRTMQYDGLDRLTRTFSPILGGNGEALYTYDALDNLKSVSDVRRRHTYSYDARNQLTGVINTDTASPVMGLVYDAQGNVQAKAGQAYDFDYGNRLREVLDVERYRYDAHGRRILAVNFLQGNVLSLYSNAGQLLFQRNQRTGQSKDIDHVYLGSSLIAQREQPIGGGAVTLKYQHTDALGTPVVVTDQTQVEIDRVDYEPYGRALSFGISTGKDRPGYTGHVDDRVTLLTYMQQRYYEPSLGIFLSNDPVSAVTSGAQFNRYRYANSNPYRLYDPDGRMANDSICGRYRGKCKAIYEGLSGSHNSSLGRSSARFDTRQIAANGGKAPEEPEWKFKGMLVNEPDLTATGAAALGTGFSATKGIHNARDSISIVTPAIGVAATVDTTIIGISRRSGSASPVSAGMGVDLGLVSPIGGRIGLRYTPPGNFDAEIKVSAGAGAWISIFDIQYEFDD